MRGSPSIGAFEVHLNQRGESDHPFQISRCFALQSELRREDRERGGENKRERERESAVSYSPSCFRIGEKLLHLYN